MGQTALSQDQLADKIEHVKGIARYELAPKAEVQAFVNRKVSVLAAIVEKEIEELDQRCAKQIDEEISAERKVRSAEFDTVDDLLRELHVRVRELELTRWQRFARWWNGFVEDVIWWFTSEPETTAEIEPPPRASRPLRDNADPYSHLTQSFADMLTESAEDLAENPIVADAVQELKKAGHLIEPSIANELPELQDLAEYSAEEMPLIGQPTEDCELSPFGRSVLEDLPGSTIRFPSAMGKSTACQECGVDLHTRHKDGCVTGAIAAIEAHDKHGTPLPGNVHRLSIPPAESLGDPEE